jgi:hypothetical protein
LSQFAIHLDEAKALSKLTIQQNPSKSQKCETEKDAPLQMHQSLLCQILQRSQKNVKKRKNEKIMFSFFFESFQTVLSCLSINHPTRKMFLKEKKHPF